ncbi:MAG: LD-carboxypeptidase [Dermatophilaceae bacterium]
MPHVPVIPPVCRPGDRVALVSPSWAAPAHYPALHDLAIARLQDDLGLIPVEHPTTRTAGAPAARARDLMAAFTDPEIRAVMATIGGDDQITVLPHLDAAALSADPRSLTDLPVDQPSPEGWTWVDCPVSVTGRTWGGNLEVLPWILGVGAHVRPVTAYEGCILLLETSEEHPPAADVRCMMTVLGERGLLSQVAGVVAARPASHDRGDDPGPSARQAYRDAQRDTIVAAVARYAPGIPVVVGVEFGHTSPQYVLPYGGPLRLDPAIGALVVENGASTPSGARQEAKGCV